MTTLFESVQIGAPKLPNRVVTAPLGRARADVQSREPTASVVTYYVQRASAGLIVSEVCGGFDRASAQNAVSETRAELIAFDAGFIANPDLVERLRRDASWNTPDPATFYTGGDQGYLDYPVLQPAKIGVAVHA